MTEDSGDDTPEGRRGSLLDGFSSEEIDDIIDDLPGGQSVSPAMRRLHQRALDARRRMPQQIPLPPPTIPGLEDGVLHAPAQPVRAVPDRPPQMWWILRRQDVTGISGVGIIGIAFVSPDGAAAYRWFGGPPQDQPKWEFYDKPGTAPFEQISGHTGRTVLVPVRTDPET